MSEPLDRRDFLARFAAFPIVSALAGGRVRRQARPTMTVYKSPTCGCCAKWIDHVRAAGFTVAIRDVNDINAVKKDLGVPAALGSCHTAVIGRYLVEGHAPADVIDKMLADKPNARGIAVPGMPSGSPGMEVPGSAGDRYDVLLFTTDGKTSVFARRQGTRVIADPPPPRSRLSLRYLGGDNVAEEEPLDSEILRSVLE